MKVGPRMLIATKYVTLNPGCIRREVAAVAGPYGADRAGYGVVARTLAGGLIVDRDGRLYATEEGTKQLAAVGPTPGFDAGVPVQRLDAPPRAETVPHEHALGAVRFTLRGVDLGEFDHKIVEWLGRLYGDATGRGLLSLIERARLAERITLRRGERY